MKHVGFRVTPEEYRHIRTTARKTGHTVSEFCRALVNSHSEILRIEDRLETIERDNVRILRDVDALRFEELFRLLSHVCHLEQRANLLLEYLIRNATEEPAEVLEAIETRLKHST